jgi:transposase
MIRGGFLSEEDRNKLIALARDGSAASRVTRRANTLVLLDDGWSCQEVADAFLLNDDTIRGWFKLFEQHGIEGLTSFDTFGTDRPVASPGARISQAECHCAQARRRQAESFYREL